MALALLSYACESAVPTVENLTGLPAYPHLDHAAMDERLRVEALGRWCSRFTASSSDSLDAVEDWYRRTLTRAGETDLARDERFGVYAALSGIKLAIGVDYVAVYRMRDRPTTIELHRCSGYR
jgi:hypothetical protein